MMKQLIVVIFSVLLLCCDTPAKYREYDPFAMEYTKKQPQVKHLHGTYEPDGLSRKWLSQHGFSVVSPVLRLKVDGRFELNNFPKCIVVWMPDCKNELRSESGKWRVGQDELGYQLILTPDIHNCDCGPYDLMYYIRGDSDPYRIQIGSDDNVYKPFLIMRKSDGG